MPTERQLRAWNELALGPLCVRRRPIVDEAVGEATDAAADTATDTAVDVIGQPDHVSEVAAPATQAPALPDSWEAVRAEVAGCRRCGLCETRKQTVFGSGSQTARWMLIGEAPGAEEDARGEPFVGQAGRLLDQILAAIGLSRDADVFICNVLKCRPPGNRNPEPLEAKTCSQYLYRQIELLQPDLIVLLGRFAMQSVLDTDASVASLRQKVHRFAGQQRNIPVVCTYHPAYLLRNLPDKRKSWEDLCLAADVAQQEQARRDTGQRDASSASA